MLDTKRETGDDAAAKGCGCLILIGIGLFIVAIVPFIIKLWKWAL